MKRIILGAFKRYNANSKNINKGDCAVRAMSLGYGIDYDVVYKELKQIQKEYGYMSYNSTKSIEEFIHRHGGQLVKDIITDSNTGEYSPSRVFTVDKFSELYSSGTYLLFTSRTENKPSDHMIAIIDGDVYDTWNSLNDIVKKAWCVSEESTYLYTTDFNMSEAAEQIWEPLSEYITAQNRKSEAMYVDLQELTVMNQDTILIKLKCQLDDSVSVYSKYRKSATLYQKFIAKFSLKKTQEENVQSLIPKLRTKMYDWMYNIRKDLEDSKKAESALRDDFYGDRVVAVKLPEWSYPYLLYATADGFSYKFEATMSAFDDDPRKSEAPEVNFYADSLRELKQQFADYKADFSRYGYDY